MVSRIRRLTTSGSAIEVETMKVWPENEEDGRPTSEYFVNQRIDLLVREAETFRSDYRNKKRRSVFLALRKPLPWADPKPPKAGELREPQGEIDTQKYCGFVLIGISGTCLVASMLIIGRQNRMTR